MSLLLPNNKLVHIVKGLVPIEGNQLDIRTFDSLADEEKFTPDERNSKVPLKGLPPLQRVVIPGGFDFTGLVPKAGETFENALSAAAYPLLKNLEIPKQPIEMVKRFEGATDC